MPSRFIIMSLPRCGSTTLMHVLNCHPEIRCIREPFNPDQWRDTYLGRVRGIPSLDATLADIWRKYNGIKHVWEMSGWPFGVDVSVNLRLLAQPEVRVVLLTRRNHLQRIISHEIAAQTDIWQRPSRPGAAEEDIASTPLAPLDPAALRRAIERSRQATALAMAMLRSSGTRFREFFYEDIYAPEHSLARVAEILGFLGAGPLPDDAEARARRLLDPGAHKLNGPLTYREVPNIAAIESACGDDETGHVFETAGAPCDS